MTGASKTLLQTDEQACWWGGRGGEPSHRLEGEPSTRADRQFSLNGAHNLIDALPLLQAGKGGGQRCSSNGLVSGEQIEVGN